MVRRVCESVGSFGAPGRCSLLLSVLLVATSCQHEKNLRRTEALPALHAASWLVELDVPGFGKSALALPLAATTPRPIVIALHGSADRPEWACASWRAIAGPHPFVLCPRGELRADFRAPDVRYTFGSADDTARELRAALAELKRRFGKHVASGPVLFVGFEIGADHAAWIARQEPAFFSRLALVAPSSSSWSSSQSALFARGGGQRVLFASGPAERAEFAQQAVLSARAGAEARLVFLGERAPALDPARRSLLAEHWRWLSAPVRSSPTLDNIAGNAMPAGGPVVGRPAP